MIAAGELGITHAWMALQNDKGYRQLLNFFEEGFYVMLFAIRDGHLREMPFFSGPDQQRLGVSCCVVFLSYYD